MKKIFIFGFIALCMSAMFSCSSCKSEKNDTMEDTVAAAGYNVENCISTDRETMFTQYGENYRWYETSITLDKFLDEENDGLVNSLTDVFQTLVEKEGGYDTKVVLFVYDENESKIEEIDGFYVGDLPLNEEAIKLTFKEAFDKLMAANLPKPHSKQCVLRKELGPKQCNAQYIFGNKRAQVYVDAVTGVVSDKNPAYDGSSFEKPKSEWP